MAMTNMGGNVPRPVYVVGVGMTKFENPFKSTLDYPEMVKEAVTEALVDSKLGYSDIEQACAGYVFGDSTSGQRALYEMGMTGIPIHNVNNNCATGSSALYLANQMIAGGLNDCVLVVGFEKMDRESFTSSKYPNQANPMDKHKGVLAESAGIDLRALRVQQPHLFFAAAGREHMKKYGTTAEHFAKIAWKNYKHSAQNPRSQRRKQYTLADILASPKMTEPLTHLQCCPVSNGAASAILMSEELVTKKGLQNQAVQILGMEMCSDVPSVFEEKSCIKLVGFDMSKLAAERLYKKTGLGPRDVDVIELHDCFSMNELITYEALGLCPVGKGGEMVDSGNNTYGGKYVVNPSGGLIAKGHPLGATGIAQCAELCWQLRGMTGPRQVKDAKIALQHNLGFGGAVVVALYRMGFPKQKIKNQRVKARL